MQIQNGIEIYRVAFSINNARYPMALAKEVHTAKGELNISSITKVKEFEIAYFLCLLKTHLTKLGLFKNDPADTSMKI